jgi:hypothetical protein
MRVPHDEVSFVCDALRRQWPDCSEGDFNDSLGAIERIELEQPAFQRLFNI